MKKFVAKRPPMGWTSWDYFIAATNYGLYQVPFLPRRIREEVVDDFQGDILGDDNRLHRFL